MPGLRQAGPVPRTESSHAFYERPDPFTSNRVNQNLMLVSGQE